MLTQVYPIKSDDFFPYASGLHSYWTGYFTSRPSIKVFGHYYHFFIIMAGLCCALLLLNCEKSLIAKHGQLHNNHHDSQTFFLAGGEGRGKGLVGLQAIGNRFKSTRSVFEEEEEGGDE